MRAGVAQWLFNCAARSPFRNPKIENEEGKRVARTSAVEVRGLYPAIKFAVPARKTETPQKQCRVVSGWWQRLPLWGTGINIRDFRFKTGKTESGKNGSSKVENGEEQGIGIRI